MNESNPTKLKSGGKNHDPYDDQLLAEQESILIDNIFKIFLGCSERELSQFEMVFNYFLTQFSGSEKEMRVQWKIDKNHMAKEMANHLYTLIQTQNTNPLEASSFHLVRDFYPKNVLKSPDVDTAQKILESYLIALQVSTLFKSWMKIKYPSYPLISTLSFFEWVDGGDVMEKVKSRVDSFSVSKRAKEFLDFIKTNGKDISKKRNIEISIPENSFIHNGDFWQITFKGNELPLIRNIDGMEYIAFLLSHPNEMVNPLKLRNLVKGTPDVDTGNMISSLPPGDGERNGSRLGTDPQIDKKSIRELLTEKENLTIELDGTASREEKERIETKIQLIEKFLSSSTNNKGEGRAFAGDYEKARQSITKAIIRARENIEKHNKDLGFTLKKVLKGLIYKPDPNNPVKWVINP